MAKRFCPKCGMQLYKEDGRWYCPHHGEVDQDNATPPKEKEADGTGGAGEGVMSSQGPCSGLN